MEMINLQDLFMSVAGLFFLFLFIKRFFFFKEEEYGASIIGFTVDKKKDECCLSYESSDGYYGQIVMDASNHEDFTKHAPLDKNIIINCEKSTFLGYKLKSIKIKPKRSSSPVNIYLY